METLQTIIIWIVTILGGLGVIGALGIAVILIYGWIIDKWVTTRSTFWAFGLLALSRSTRSILHYAVTWERATEKEVDTKTLIKIRKTVIDRVQSKMRKRVRRNFGKED